MSSAYAQLPCPDCAGDDPRVIAQQLLLEDIPISLWTDRETYDHNDTIIVEGRVANVVSGVPVTLTVISSLNSVITIDQVSVDEMGNFATSFNTAGDLWKYDGTYFIKANYGSAEKSNKVLVELVGGITSKPTTPVKPVSCGASEFAVEGKCVPYSITGGVITGTSVNTNDNSLIVKISANEDGTLTIRPSADVLDGAFMVLVDGEEWDDVEINGNEISVMFLAGAEEIEIIGTFVVPEFGAIAALILAVAIISIIVVSAKSRLSIMPRY
ncbi:MAG: PEFG-CTERM sorting domain-containing protein [Nitrososphaeria archaeon]|nr:PEFG-CTERM sorting domain-containing protein [Nitrosopumilaceae archaeon]NIP09433.1 PEFG-CTERM sorting domain-containing protein [Nitrosopumilaceae archaeon]NIP91756.1 PEFG-CTERM sorting domain-containing protein [Nitrososphaeria archaeon]NIS95649.1 PEFG-CTERM sorting domain-containing protein [Nitrosopumilaceae archaeon]